MSIERCGRAMFDKFLLFFDYAMLRENFLKLSQRKLMDPSVTKADQTKIPFWSRNGHCVN